jgi:hypothetical protein
VKAYRDLFAPTQKGSIGVTLDALAYLPYDDTPGSKLLFFYFNIYLLRREKKANSHKHSHQVNLQPKGPWTHAQGGSPTPSTKGTTPPR